MRAHRRGANAIEFALTLPLFLLVLTALIEYGYLFAMQAGLESAVALSCRAGAMIDPRRATPGDAAASEFEARGAIFCGGGGLCTFSSEDLKTNAYAVPNRTLRCFASREMQELTNFFPRQMYPSQITSVSYYRLEWQRN